MCRSGQCNSSMAATGTHHLRWRLDVGVVDIVHKVGAKYPRQVWSEPTDDVGAYVREAVIT